MSEKELYVYLSQSEQTGNMDSSSDKPYEGYRHKVKTILQIGPARIDTKAPDWDYEGVEEVHPDVLNTKAEYITVVHTIHSDGDIFGRTEGYINFVYATTTKDDADKWIKKNRKRLEREYNTYFGKLDDLKAVPIHLWK